jgi:type I restriction enzyme R subunit
VKKRILFLADRNILITQTKKNDFKHFKDKLTIIRKKKIDKAYEIYLALYQGLTNYNEDKDAFRQFSPDFFDLIVVDECHRGSAAADSAWREILTYFSSATQIGLTATPRETNEVSNIDYFGEPTYTYSLRQGIEDGFLAPYKVIRVGINTDLEGWRPYVGKTDKDGNEVEDRIYNVKDVDKNIVIDERTQLVAKKITEFLKKTNRYDKTIVFCVDIEHAERMRSALARENPDLVQLNSKYVMRITGDDIIGKNEVDNFINPEERYPVIATTSKLMTTGVDAQTCKLIVLDSNIQSVTEFKQIIGRGTRIREDYGKTFFTILDFRNVTDIFARPEFDGDPVMIRIIDATQDLTDEDINQPAVEEGEIAKPETGKTVYPEIIGGGSIIAEPRSKIYVNGVDVAILNERVQHLDADGKLITESLKDYTRKKILGQFLSLDDFLSKWNKADKKKVIIDELEEHNVIFANLASEVKKDLDVFDLVCHIAWDQPPLSRRDRAERVRKRDYFTKYGDKARMVISALLDKYADEGVENIEDPDVLRVEPFNQFGTPTEIIKLFGGMRKYLDAIGELEKQLYAVA